MTADIVNLRRARKAKARSGKDAEAAENRAKFGRTKAERARDAIEQARARRAVDGALRQNDDGNGCDDDR